MIVESIELYNYRNLDSAKIPLSPGVNILYGDNAQGKTNFLEAVYVSSTTRSHRGSRDRDLIRFGEDESHIRLMFKKKGLSHRLDVHIRKTKTKGIAVDGIPVRRSGEFIGMIPVVFFSPEDLSIVKQGPSGRRRFMDMELSQMDPVYMSHLIRYNKALSERNNLLKQIIRFPALVDTLDGWDAQLISSAFYIIEKRKEFCRQIHSIMNEIHLEISGGRENVQVDYDANVQSEDIEHSIRQTRNKDIQSGSTSRGPHRDDIKITVNGTDIRRFGSQGQQRTAALSLKLSEIRLIESVRGEKPVLLLDDVLSELDSRRQHELLCYIREVQTLVTCTGMEDLIDLKNNSDRIFFVSSGIIKDDQEITTS